MTPLLSLKNLNKVFSTQGHTVTALSQVDLNVYKGDCLALVGESGSGKSTIANVILGMLAPSSGEVFFKGELLSPKRNKPLRRMIQFVQQNPLSALNPKKRIGSSLRLPLDVHNLGKASERSNNIRGLLEEVDLPRDFVNRYPDALSGGQRQRVAIARALACQPELVVLDEPTSALDVLVQARVLKMLSNLQKNHGLTYVFITHDLGVVRNFANRVAVMERGRVVETGDIETIFSTPVHEYTRKLISAIPVVSDEEESLRSRLAG